MCWVEVDRAGRSWVEVDGAGWSGWNFVEVCARFSNIRLIIC